jgi:hypothetical protein
MFRFRITTALWIGVLYLAGAATTVATLYSFIIPEYRGTTFYTVLIGCCAAELVFFAYLLHVLMARDQTSSSRQAVRSRTAALVALWTLTIIVSGAVALNPSVVDTFYSDKLVFFQLILTFFVLTGAYLFQRQGLVVEESQVAPQAQRIRFQSYAAGISPLVETLRSTADRCPGGAVELDRLAKRLDTLKTQLLSVSPMAERDTPRLVQPVTAEEIENRLKQLHSLVLGLPLTAPEDLTIKISAVRQAVDGAIASLRHREDSLTF